MVLALRNTSHSKLSQKSVTTGLLSGRLGLTGPEGTLEKARPQPWMTPKW